jgi:cytoskeletal protein CcmA (bactofilin family)
MFSSKSKDSAFVPTTVNAAPPPAKRPGRSATAPSIVSADLTVTGALNTRGDMQIDGVLEGDVRSVGLVIGEGAEIRGEIWAEDVTVRGRVIGRIHARKVLLSATCHVEGDILHEAFAVEAGAFFEGSCRHSDNPLGDEMQKPLPQQTVIQPSPQPLQQASVATLAPLLAT